MISSAVRTALLALRRAWRRAIGLVVRSPPLASPSRSSPTVDPDRRSPELEELFRAATALRAEDGLIPMSALRRLSAEDRSVVQRLSQAEARKMVIAWARASGAGGAGNERDRGAPTSVEVTEPYRRPR